MTLNHMAAPLGRRAIAIGQQIQIPDQWDTLGGLDTGKQADIVAVPGKLTDDVALFGQVFL